MKENKLVQEALIQMKQVEEAIAENAKGILASTMKEEINQLVKESLSEQADEDEVELDVDMDMSADNDEVDMDMDIDSDDSDDMDMDFGMDSDETPIDLTDASDEEILKVFKAMGEDDGIIVKKDGENVHLTDDDADVEYLVKLGESEDDMMEEDDMEDSEMMEEDGEVDESVDDVIDAIFSGNMSDVDSEDMSDDEVVYEITLDDDSEMMEDDSEMMEEDDMDYDSEMMEEDDMEDSEMMEEDDMEDDLTNETYKPKGVGMGKPKFDYKKTTGGFKEDMKQGPKSVGTGKAKFDYKKGANMEGKSKIVKAETKEGNYGMNRN